MSYGAMASKQKRLIKKDIELLFSARAFSPSTIDDWKRLGIGSLAREIKVKGGGSVLLSEQGFEALRRLSETIGEVPALDDSVSLGDVLTKVKTSYNDWLLRELQPDGQEFIDPIVAELQGQIKDYEFVIKLEGLDLKDQNALDLGAVRIQRSDQTVLQKVDFTALDPEWVYKQFESSIWLFGKTRGSKVIALERFHLRVVLTVGILAACSAVLFADAFRRSRVHPLISIAGPAGTVTLLSWEKGGNNPSVSRRWGREQDLPLDANAIEYLTKECFFRQLASLPDRAERTELQDAIVRSLYWIADAHSDRNPPMQFVKLWSCLECFFTIGHDQITEKNARGIASILAFGGYAVIPPNDYAATKRRVKELYGLRSKAVHSAKFDHIETTDVDELARWVGWIIISMVSLSERGYTTLRQVNDQVLRLDGPQDVSIFRRWSAAITRVFSALRFWQRG